MTTRSARAGLAIGVHWRSLDPEVHLGYRKGKRGGSWLVRWRSGLSYKQAGLGTADDVLREGTLSFDAAAAEARRFVEVARVAAQAEAAGPPLSVRIAVEEYIDAYRARLCARMGREPSPSISKGSLHRHVLSDEIADTPLHELSRDKLKAWRRRVVAKRLSVSTVRRICNDFRAALNSAADAYHTRVPPALPVEIKSGLASTERDYSPVAREAQVLTDADVRRVIAAAWQLDADCGWEGDLGRIVLVLAATGARFSQIIRVTVADVQAVQRRMMVPTSHKGRGQKAAKIAVPVGDDVIEALRPAMAGRVGAAPLLERWRHKQTAPAVWVRTSRGAWQSSAELARPWRQIIRAAGLPADVVPYALRHSSIVRGLREMLPVRLVAALHDTSSVMIEKHYSSFIVSALDELAARAIVPLHTPAAEVISLRRAGS